ncbi:beta-glucuronidase [Pseudoxanthomonas broegbernensis]|uniref:Beta-glucuronidase n=1 Tax=Pseudoxanthomonas broegbernensis TaxID=83619 RepID=A0A7V8GKP8_9GAMM|nr:glycoside hydrolase family 2 TIM barrel-domain containing protein [Pseudoxanthomonas broegbernensis]KAF1685270.1 beta-glucuronidase [Pseudoxanthomonas broegbernensis]MBB6066164.1 beta-glucuronidase [Pseudoxanthomonas broegbernensis]
MFVLCWLLSLWAAGACAAPASDAPMQVYTRATQSLDGEWKAIVDPYENGYYNYRYEPFDRQPEPPPGAFFTDSKMRTPSELIEYDFDKSISLQVPGDWNTQDPRLYYYEGSVWYRKKFDAPSHRPSDRVFVHFGAVNYRADVYLNGRKLGVHEGGFTPFRFEVTGRLKDAGNSLVLKVDNKRHADGVPTLNTDWWNYGGITRSVELVVVPAVFVRDYRLALASLEDREVEGSVLLDGAQGGERVVLSLPELGIRESAEVAADGRAGFRFRVPGAHLWSPGNPRLYRVEIATEGDTLVDRVGLRTIAARGRQLLLNGEPVFLRGISVHEEYSADGGGRVRDAQQARQLLQWAKELDANFVRLAHYPHNEHIVRLADEMGLLAWSEIPVYWTIDWTNEATYRNAQDQLAAMIGRDANRASVVVWSLANETPVSEARNRFLSRLVAKARALDDTRLLSAAMEKHYRSDDPDVAVVEDPLADLLDLVSFNQYIGWYDGPPEKADRVRWEIPYDKPVFVSEFGGDALQGLHGDAGQIWTEEFQENLYRRTLAMLDRIEGYAGVSPWILADFRSPRRLLPGIQDDYNRKGVMSEKGVKKKAFFVLRDYYRGRAGQGGGGDVAAAGAGPPP